MIKYAITMGLTLMLSIQIAYGQVMEPRPAPDTNLEEFANLRPNQALFSIFVNNAEPNNDYRLCGGTVGNVKENFGCGEILKGSQLIQGYGSTWKFSRSGDTSNSDLYGCVIDNTKKQVSCDVAIMAETGNQRSLYIDWSLPSNMGIPSHFSPIAGSTPVPIQSNDNDNDREEEEDND